MEVIIKLGFDQLEAQGYLKGSPMVTLIADAIGGDIIIHLDLFDFNDTTGEITNFRTVGSKVFS